MQFEGEEKILLQKNDLDHFKEEYKNLDKYIKELEDLALLPLKKIILRYLSYQESLGRYLAMEVFIPRRRTITEK